MPSSDMSLICSRSRSFASLSDEELQIRVAEMLKPDRFLMTNGAPILVPKYDPPADTAGREIDSDELNRSAGMLKNNRALRERLIQEFTASQAPKGTSEHFEEQLYAGLDRMKTRH
jgi:exonuclease I